MPLKRHLLFDMFSFRWKGEGFRNMERHSSYTLRTADSSKSQYYLKYLKKGSLIETSITRVGSEL